MKRSLFIQGNMAKAGAAKSFTRAFAVLVLISMIFVISPLAEMSLLAAQTLGGSSISTAVQSGMTSGAAQGSSAGQSGGALLPEATARAQIAMATADYPVTPGDVYSLIYMRASQTDSLRIVVEGDGKANLGFLGKLSSEGMTFRAFKALVESKIEAAYPQSTPSLLIVSTGVFPIKVQGHVQETSIVSAWGLTRLSEVVAGKLLAYSSLRDVQVASSNGKVAVYDLFKAEREGDLGQDPYMRPGDVVELRKADRVVRLEGEVRRSGSYQLKAGEGVGELVGYYGDGLGVSAKSDMVVLTRSASEGKPESESVVFDLSSEELPALLDGDSVRVPSREEYLPIVYVEGAVKPEVMVGQEEKAQEGEEEAKETYGLVRVVYREGQLLSQVVEPLKERFSEQGDLEHAYIVRGSERIGVDLERLLYQYSKEKDILLMAGDRVVIPYGYASVYVKGEVKGASVVEVYGGLRLSAAIKNNLTSLSSMRDVEVKGTDGKLTVYDLFRYEREGEISQNPLLRPGDVVTVKRAERVVTLEGEVLRPGTYQLLEGEGIRELISYYGDGLGVSAKSDMVVLTRRATEGKPESESIVFDLGAKELPSIEDGDSIRVASREEYLPIVYVEGAIVIEGSPIGEGRKPYNLQRVLFRKGQSVMQVMKPLEGKLYSSADLQKSYIIRGQERIGIDLEKLLHSYTAADDIELQANDRIVIPYGVNYAYVTGFVARSVSVEITSQSRLSEILKDLTIERSSRRDIVVRSADGKLGVYDLFKAERKGEVSQDPYIRPGDTVEVKRASRQVNLGGEVRRPGTYQLLEGEGVRELISYYGDGLGVSAKSDMVVLTRRATEEKPESESVVFDLASEELPALLDGDSIRVASREEYLPIVYIEGALKSEEEIAALAAGTKAQGVGTEEALKEAYRIVRVVYREGELLSQVVEPLKERFSEQGDLEHAYIVRGRERIGVDLETLLYQYSKEKDIVLMAGDRVVIPYGYASVYVKGEVKGASVVEVYAGLRLSEALKDNLTSYSSFRDIVVRSVDGKVATYDLFKAEREGDLREDPLLRPGDTVEVKRASRQVSLSGEVRRPGSYQLLENEGVNELISYYGDGLGVSAKSDMVVLTRKASEAKPESESVVFDLASEELPALLDGDSIRVASREEYLPIVYIEGALKSEEEIAALAAGTKAQGVGTEEALKQAYRIVRVVYREGELLSQVVRPLKDRFSDQGDLGHAYIVRGSERISVDLETLLYQYSKEKDIVLMAGDRVVIPYGYASVYVKGEVKGASVVEVYGGLRLSEAIKDNLTSLSSMRDVEVKGTDGKLTVYDLFRYEREGEISQNPLLRPGDVVTVKRAERVVTLEGEVRRPGIYQLTGDEGVDELISYYGDGLGVSAKSDMVVLTRSASEERPESESVVFDLASAELPALLDGDSIRVASREEYLPIIYIEGAIAGDIVGISTSEQTVAQTNYAVLRTAYREGITVSTLLRPLKDKILPSANMEQAFIIRKGQETQIMINLETLLYGIDLSGDVVLKPEDKIVIPYGSMYVFVTGEVTKSSWVGITGLTRLRDAVTPLLTRYSSLRDVKVKSADGYEKIFDLFKAERYGDLSQDPFLRPGDEIRISSLTNLVTIQGEVKRPGTYQLLPGEGLKELVSVYADGFTEKANTSRLTLLHYLSESSPVGEKMQFDYTKFPDMELRLYDVVTVPSLQELLPVAWFEGAVGLSSTGASPETSQRSAYTFVPGETVSQAALTNRKLFSAVSDLSSAYIIHADGSQTAVDLAKFIYDYDLTNDIQLRANDIIIVPFRQFFVSVSGAVRYPGRYPYIPKRTWEYYVGLAGGFDTDRNSGQKIEIYDVKSNKVAIAGREIQPEDNIVAESNSFTYNMMKISSILSSVLSLTVLIISILGM